jgi:hypothetical protein
MKRKELKQSDFGFHSKVRPRIKGTARISEVGRCPPLIHTDRSPLGWSVRAVDLEEGLWRVEVIDVKDRIEMFETFAESREQALISGRKLAWMNYHKRYAKTKRGGDYVFGG